MGEILIKNGRVWDGFAFSRQDVLLADGRVQAMAPELPAASGFVFDAAGSIVSPGLVDAHMHIRVRPGEKYGTPAELSCFPFGVTAAADADRIRGDPAVLESMLLKNVVFATVRIRENCPDFAPAEEALARFGDRVVGIKVYYDTTMDRLSGTGPLEEICRFAKDRGLRVMVHCANSPVPMAYILDVLRPGDILTHAFHGGVHTAMEDGFAAMRRAKGRGVVIDAGFAAHVHTDFTVFGSAVKSGVLPDVISTDLTRFSAFFRGGRYGMTMCMSMALHFGMEEADIFRAVTSAPAAALGKAGQWGEMKVGGPADLAVLRFGDEGFCLTDKAGNRAESKKGYRCLLTVTDGQIVYKD